MGDASEAWSRLLLPSTMDWSSTDPGGDLFVPILRQAARIERLRLFYIISPSFDASRYGNRVSLV